jgi:hypothetical protein
VWERASRLRKPTPHRLEDANRECTSEHCDKMHRRQADEIVKALKSAGYLIVQKDALMKLNAMTLPAMVKAFDL